MTKHHPEFATQHTEIPWGFAYEMRNALAHGYFTVDLNIVWQTLQNDLPTLKVRLDSIVSESFGVGVLAPNNSSALTPRKIPK